MLVRLAFSILFANLALVFGAGTLFAVGVPFGPIWWGLYGAGALVGAVAFGNLRFEISNLRSTIAVLFLHAFLLFVATGIASRFIDVGWDSLETHQRAVLLIREGWNIVDPEPGWLGEQPEDGILRREPSVFTQYLDFNAMYVLASLFADLPFGFEGAKGYRLMLLFMAGVLVGHLLRRAGLGVWGSAGVGLFVALNPVCLYQLWVLFMDFDLAVYSTLAVLSLVAFSWRGDRQALCVALVCIVLLFLSKRSGLALAAPLIGFVIVGFLARRFGWLEKGLSEMQDSVRSGVFRFLKSRSALIGVLSVVIAPILLLVVLGSVERNAGSRDGAYYSLEFVQRAVLNPDQFDRNLDLIVPDSHSGLPRPVQFGRSLFERTAILRGADIKVPLTWVSGEWETFRNIHWPGHGSGGFGPLFSGVSVFAVLALLAACRGVPPLTGGSVFQAGLFMVLVGICFVLPSWWARWVPFVWVMPLFFLLPPLFWRARSSKPSLLLLAGRHHLLPSICAAVALGLGIANSTALLVVATDESLHVTHEIEDSLDAVSGQTVVLDPGRNLLTKRWLIERGIDYQLSDEKGELLFELEPSTSRLYQPVNAQ